MAEPTESQVLDKTHKKKRRKKKSKAAKHTTLFRGLRYARVRCRGHSIGGVIGESGAVRAVGPAVLGCPSHDRAGLQAAFLSSVGADVPMLCTVGEDMQVMLKRVYAGPASDGRPDVSLQHVATMLGHTGSPRAVASCSLPCSLTGTLEAPAGLLVTCGAAKEVIIWALTREAETRASVAPVVPSRVGETDSASERARLVLPEFVAGLRLLGRPSQLLAVTDGTKASDRLEAAGESGLGSAPLPASSSLGATSEDDIETAEQRITSVGLAPLQTAGGASIAVGFASCTSGQLLVFAAGPFGDAVNGPAKLELLRSIDLGQPLLSVHCVRTTASDVGSSFIVLCGGTGGVLFLLRVSMQIPVSGIAADSDRSGVDATV